MKRLAIIALCILCGSAQAQEEPCTILGIQDLTNLFVSLQEQVTTQQQQINQLLNAELTGTVDSVFVTNGIMSVLYRDGTTTEFVVSPVLGCLDSSACNYTVGANIDDGSCIASTVLYADKDNDALGDPSDSLIVCDGTTVEYYVGTANDGCDDPTAINYADSNTSACEYLSGCSDSISHYGYSYSVKAIGNQCWYGENVKHTQGYLVSPSGWDFGTSDANGWRCTYVDNNPETRDEAGLLYGVHVWLSEEVCPTGWHSAKNSDWDNLMIHLGVQPATVYNNPSYSSFTSSTYGTPYAGDAVYVNGPNFTGISLGLGGSIDPWGNYGGCLYWRSIINGTSYSYSLRFSGTPRKFASYGSKGFHIRCVKD